MSQPRRHCVTLIPATGRWASPSAETIPTWLRSSHLPGGPHAAPSPIGRNSCSWGLGGPCRLRRPLGAAAVAAGRGSYSHKDKHIAAAAATSSASAFCIAALSASRREPPGIRTFHRAHGPHAVVAAPARGPSMGSGGGGCGGGGNHTRRPGVLSATTAAAAGEGEVEAEVAPYLGPVPDLVTALDALSYTRTFTEMCIFLENKSPLFRGPEVAALILQAASVSELAAQRQVAAAMEVADRRSSELAAAAAGAGGAPGPGGLSAEMLAGVVDEALSAAGPGGGGGGGGAVDPEDEKTVLDELVAANQLLDWATPLLRAHIKRYPPDAVSALLASLAQLQQYDRRLMELAAETFKSDPRDWVRRAAPPPSAAAADAPSGGISNEGADPWFTLVTLAGAFARLGHYDRELMAAVAKQAVELMPQVWERAEAEDAEAAAGWGKGEGEGHSGADGLGGGGAFRVTETVMALVSSFLELYHLDPPLMQAAGEHLAAFAHQLGPDSVCEVVGAFAGFQARNPPFYSLMLRRLLEVEAEVEGEGEVAQGGGSIPIITPRAAGTLYRACTLLKARGDVPELIGADVNRNELDTAGLLPLRDPMDASPSAAVAGGGESDDGGSRLVAMRLSRLLRRCLESFPLPALQATPLGRPTPEQLEAAGGQAPELLEAWEATGLLTVPQILSTLQDVPSVEPLPPSALTAAAAAPPVYGSNDDGEGYAGDSNEDVDEAVVGGADAVAWVPPDALMLYDSTGSGFGARIAVKALDEKLHCCRNIGLDPDSEPDRPEPRSRGALAAAAPPPPLPRRRGRLLRLRGPALSELRCLEVWGWRVLVVPVGVWAGMDLVGRRTWLVRQLDELEISDDPCPGDTTGISPVLGPELWV
ncbi:hypothetical protein VOLCADRAFT_88640 [Volvox carteri f. nagariensis]|uniref:Uncharacterized protein n=1 Tax=Volvox carteri f. nagariensis TaxID=3068 RepID=D8TPJ5_VOLCA|nr:uncharacterized protein VOLCADRAFT_88640 [Volvox carteri f. nagariensis]EFJ50627.1 hypothetical protein VOLCADRAFT_88640 [Volvox carteri f. nagariensis]|eukprot:XP_002948220.1 hypothetical protein VOLCADRAFT_88640 [Volvox carteri f. nagariensis]